MRTHAVRLVLILFLPVIGLASGCTFGGEDPEATSEIYDEEIATEDGGRITRTIMQYEGSCDFLRSCSVYSRNGIQWGCGNDLVGSGCDMSERWVAIPASMRNKCGGYVTICRAGTDNCTTAKVKDVSCCNRWEASHQVLQDLGVGHGSNPSSCSGYGDVRVDIYEGGSGSRGSSGGGGGGSGSFNGTYCAQAGYSCGGNSPCWAQCPAGSSCDFAEGTWGYCRN